MNYLYMYVYTGTEFNIEDTPAWQARMHFKRLNRAATLVQRWYHHESPDNPSNPYSLYR